MRLSRGIHGPIIVIVSLVLLAAFAHPNVAGKGSGGDDDQLRAAQAELFAAVRHADRDGAARVLNDGLTWVRPNGAVEEKQAFLTAFPAAPREVNVERIRLLGGAAVVTGIARFDNGRDVRFLQEWVKHDGRWKLLTHHGAPMSRSSATPAGTSGDASVAPRVTDAAVSWTRRGAAPALNSEDERTVWRTEQDLEGAYLKGKVRDYTKLTAHEYTRVGPDGTEEPKYDLLKGFAAIAGRAEESPGRLETSDVRITVNGDTARLLMMMWGTLPGGEEFPPTRVTTIFQKRNRIWLQTVSVFTRVAEP